MNNTIRKYISKLYVFSISEKLKRKKKNIKYSFPLLRTHFARQLSNIKQKKIRLYAREEHHLDVTSQSLWHKKQIDAFTSQPRANKKKAAPYFHFSLPLPLPS